MTAQVTADSRKPANDAPSLMELHHRLDNLWTSYLEYLDHYATAQKLLQTHLRAAFLSLARANFNARGTVRMYGKDFYPERMIASRRARISAREEDQCLQIGLVFEGKTASSDGSTEIGADGGQVESKVEGVEQNPSPPLTPTDPTNDETSPSKGHSSPATKGSKLDEAFAEEVVEEDGKSDRPTDPLRWFGILVPPDLRSAQACFTSAVETAAVDAINASRRMREIEVKIRRLRKDIKKAEKPVA